MEKNKIPVIILGAFFVVFLGYRIFAAKNYLSIHNSSAEILKDVKVIYGNKEQLYLGNLYPSSTYQLKLPKLLNETSVSVVYNDANNMQSALVIPYLVLAENKNYQYRIN